MKFYISYAYTLLTFFMKFYISYGYIYIYTYIRMVTKLTLFFETLQKYIDSNKLNKFVYNKRLNKNMNNCLNFRKNSYYDANFCLIGQNSHKHSPEIGKCKYLLKSAWHFPMQVWHILAKFTTLEKIWNGQSS
jgi:hypothetical protein